MRIAIVGAGSLGSAIGGLLALDGHDVTLLTRNIAHVDAVKNAGLVLDDGERHRTVHLAATTSAAEIGPVELAVILVKSFDTRDAAVSCIDLLAADGVCLTLQNGVGCEDIIGEVIGLDRVVAGRTFVGGRLTAPGVVEYGVVGRLTTIGELDGTVSARVTELAARLSAAGIETSVSDDIVAMMWEKLFVNVATGAWSALTGLPYGELSTHPDVEAAAIATVAESIEVARAIGVRVETTDPAVPWRRAWAGLPHEFRASMLQSVDKGSRTEVDVIHGAVCAAGRRAGVPTPINDTLLAAVRGLERRLELQDRP